MALNKQSKQTRSEYRTRLNASIEISRQLLTLGLHFRGHDESETSKRKGLFLHFLKWHSQNNENVGSVTFKNAPGNNQMIAPSIQRDIANACSKEVVCRIMEDIGEGYFSILADESKDISCKEQLALVLRYVDKMGFVMERLIGLIHVNDTCSLSVQKAIYLLLSQNSSSPSRIRGQGYDRASNMQGHIKGLRSLIMKDSPSAHYIHCFAHQLQLTLVTVINNHFEIEWFLDWVNQLLNVVGTSYKNRDGLREKQAEKVKEAIEMGELETGKGLNQMSGLERHGDTRWGSHFRTFTNIIVIFPSIIDVLSDIGEDGRTSFHKSKAKGLLDTLQSFDFAFILHLLKLVLGITNALSQSLQRRDQDIVNAIALVNTVKSVLQESRDDKWNSFLETVGAFCGKHEIEVPNMDDVHTIRGRSNRKKSPITNEHYYRVDMFYAIIDMLLLELNSRFNETTTDLLLGVACLNPSLICQL